MAAWNGARHAMDTMSMRRCADSVRIAGDTHEVHPSAMRIFDPKPVADGA